MSVIKATPRIIERLAKKTNMEIKMIAEQYETMLERFWENVQDDTDLESYIYRIFGDNYEYYLYCKEGYRNESLVDEAFDTLYPWDAERLLHDPMGTIVAYEKEKKR